MSMPEADFSIAADAYLVGLAPLYGGIRALPKAQSAYRRHGGNHSAGGYDAMKEGVSGSSPDEGSPHHPRTWWRSRAPYLSAP